MKVLVLTLTMVWLPAWLSATVATACDGHGEGGDAVVWVTDGEAKAGADCVIKKVITRAVGGDNDDAVIVVAAFGEDSGDGRSEPRVLFIGNKDGAKERGWLGVSVGDVPQALAVQLDIEGEGVLVRDVVADSPAAKGGVETHDVILEINGEAVEGDVRRAVKLIKSHKPGDELDIIVLRDGRERELTVTLGSRADAVGIGGRLRFQGLPDAEFEDHVRTFGRMMRRGEDGEWIFEDLGDLHKLKHLPKNLKMFLPGSGSRSMQIFVEGGRKKIKTRVERDGGVIVVEREDEGEITVTRTDEDGLKTENVYADADELRQTDEEAYELLDEMGAHMVVKVHVDDLENSLSDFDFQFEFDTDQWQEKFEGWQEHLEKSLAGAHEAREQAMESVREMLEQLKEGEGLPDDLHFDQLPKLLRLGEGLSGLRHFAPLHRFGKPRHTFEVRADGTIEVRIRRGGSELVQLFEDENDLAERRPGLFKKYDQLMNAEEDDE